MGPRWRLIGSRELISKETFQQHEVKMSYNLPLDFQWNMKVQISVYLHKKKPGQIFCLFLAFLFSLSIMSNSSRCHGLQHSRLPCPSPSPSLLTVMSIESMMSSSHPLSPPSLSALNLSQHRGLFQQVCSLHQVAKVWELQHQSLEKMGEVIYIIYLTELRQNK